MVLSIVRCVVLFGVVAFPSCTALSRTTIARQLRRGYSGTVRSLPGHRQLLPSVGHRSTSLVRMSSSDQNEAAKAKEMRVRLRAEAESPFSKVRNLFCWFTVASASVAAFISLTRIIAFNAGISGTQPLSETVPNLAIDVTSVAIALWFLKVDDDAEKSRIRRITRGSAMAALPVRAFDAVTKQRAAMTLSDFRRSKPVILVAGNAAVAEECVTSIAASGLGAEVDAKVLVVPVCLEGEFEPVTTELPNCVALPSPASLGKWRDFFADELKTADGQGIDALARGLVLSVKTNGKIARRSVGIPMWVPLANELASIR
jgi:hypothetical protein